MFGQQIDEIIVGNDELEQSYFCLCISKYRVSFEVGPVSSRNLWKVQYHRNKY
jgi:hypothetical protein